MSNMRDIYLEVAAGSVCHSVFSVKRSNANCTRMWQLLPEPVQHNLTLPLTFRTLPAVSLVKLVAGQFVGCFCGPSIPLEFVGAVRGQNESFPTHLRRS
jgi:hypothetical protein